MHDKRADDCGNNNGAGHKIAIEVLDDFLEDESWHGAKGKH